MNPYGEVNSIPYFWLSCLIIDEEAMCQTVRWEKELVYVSELG